MTEIEVALSRLDKVKPVAGGYQARCPCHDDRVASLSISEKGGRFLAYCFAGCKFTDIIKALDLRPKDWLEKSTEESPRIVATYDYEDKDGKLLYQKVRYQPKSFKHRRPDGKDWIWGLGDIQPTLYKLPELIQAIKDKKLIAYAEGEKDVDNLCKNGITATTAGGVGNKIPTSHIPIFFGARVAIIPDQDDPGRKYGEYAANTLFQIASSVRIVKLPVKDVSDYLLSNPIDNLLDIYENSPEYIPAGVVTREEFNEMRGLNIFLIKHLSSKKNYKSRGFYDSV
mgnify:CR=1 FL=1